MRLAPFAPKQDLQPVPFPLQPVEFIPMPHLIPEPRPELAEFCFAELLDELKRRAAHMDPAMLPSTFAERCAVIYALMLEG